MRSKVKTETGYCKTKWPHKSHLLNVPASWNYLERKPFGRVTVGSW
jgi:hypothetical protein